MLASTANPAVRRSVDRRLAILYLGLAGVSLPFWPFPWHLTLHVLGATALIGNALVMAVWLTIAGFSTRDAWKRRAAEAVIVGDLLFTVPGVALLLANGLAMVFERYGGSAALTTIPFIGIGLVLLSLTGLVWATRLVPAQLRLRSIARAAGPLDGRAYRSVLIVWSAWGVLATILPILAVVVMTTKPTF